MFGSYYSSNPFEDPVKKIESSFDLVYEQEMIRDIFDPKKLYNVWESYNISYRDGKIGKYELEELKESVFAQFKKIEAAKSALD